MADAPTAAAPAPTPATPPRAEDARPTVVSPPEAPSTPASEGEREPTAEELADPAWVFMRRPTAAESERRRRTVERRKTGEPLYYGDYLQLDKVREGGWLGPAVTVRRRMLLLLM